MVGWFSLSNLFLYLKATNSTSCFNREVEFVDAFLDSYYVKYRSMNYV